MKCKSVIFLVGIPGAGKSTLAKRLVVPGYSTVVAFDDHAPKDAESFKTGWKTAYNKFVEDFVVATVTHECVIVDSTNSSPVDVQNLTLRSPKSAEITFIYIPVSIEEAIKRRPYLPKEILLAHESRIELLRPKHYEPYESNWMTLGDSPASTVAAIELPEGVVVG